MFNCCDCRKDDSYYGTERARFQANGNGGLVSPGRKSKCGCGIIFAADARGALVVDGLVPGGSAEASGLLKRGDVLIQVGEQDVFCRPVGQIGPLLLGPPGSAVNLVLERTGDDGMVHRVPVSLDRRPTQMSAALSVYEGRASKVP
mmetsp:Transcript_45800/g.91907  ORF Transcript_45800/g.91907 Transcript_45800/m.91907 type:complete len:146 (+) Transcript_45800:93-530(+)